MLIIFTTDNKQLTHIREFTESTPSIRGVFDIQHHLNPQYITYINLNPSVSTHSYVLQHSTSDQYLILKQTHAEIHSTSIPENIYLKIHYYHIKDYLIQLDDGNFDIENWIYEDNMTNDDNRYYEI
jgi:hypothetical protein